MDHLAWSAYCVDGRKQGELHDKVDASTKGSSQDTVDPEERKHGIQQPRSGLAGRCAVLCDVDEYQAQAHHTGGHEESLCGVEDGGFEGRGPPVESERDKSDVHQEEDNVQEEEYEAYSVEAVEAVGN